MTGEYELGVPVALLMFNRPETTEKILSAIRRARPRKLLVVADGPRAAVPRDAERCAAARSLVDRVDWPCDVRTNFSDVNLGCRRRVSSGLDWVFETVEEAIILEDDCLPDPTFFRYCAELLERYRDDERVALVSGDNFQRSRRHDGSSYYFSRYAHIWGWASWRRTWAEYDVDMALWPGVRDAGRLRRLLRGRVAAQYWTGIFDKVHRGEIDTWDYQLVFSCWARERLCILPGVNLVSNIGFGEGGTHTTGPSAFANLPTEPLSFPLEHPPRVERDVRADDHTEQIMFSGTWRRKKRAKAVLRDLWSQMKEAPGAPSGGRS